MLVLRAIKYKIIKHFKYLTIAVMLFCAFKIYTKFYYVNSIFLPRLETHILGCINTDQKQIMQLIPYTHINKLPLHEIRDALLQLPWIEAVRLQRFWPKDFVVTIKEKQPLALWQLEGQTFLIARDGSALQIQNIDLYKHFPMVIGFEANVHAAKLLKALQQLPELESRLLAATFVSKRRWDLYLYPDLVIKLAEGNICKRLQSLKGLQHKYQILKRDIKVLDLRYNNKAIIELPKQILPAAGKAVSNNKSS